MALRTALAQLDLVQAGDWGDFFARMYNTDVMLLL